MRNAAVRLGSLGLIAAFAIVGACVGWAVAGVVQRNSRTKKPGPA